MKLSNIITSSEIDETEGKYRFVFPFFKKICHILLKFVAQINCFLCFVSCSVSSDSGGQFTAMGTMVDDNVEEVAEMQS